MRAVVLGLMLVCSGVTHAWAQDSGTPSAPQAQDPYDMVTGVLDVSDAIEDLDGYKPTGWIEKGMLATGKTTDLQLTLEGGSSYEAIGNCGPNCNGLKLEVFDSAGVSLGRDVDTSPMIAITRSGSFTLRVTMLGCTTASCAYGVKSYRK